MRVRPTLLAVAGTTAAVVALGAVQLAPGTAPVARADGLVGYTGCDELVDAYRAELARTVTAYGFGFDSRLATADVEASGATGTGAPTATRDTAASKAATTTASLPRTPRSRSW